MDRSRWQSLVAGLSFVASTALGCGASATSPDSDCASSHSCANSGGASGIAAISGGGAGSIASGVAGASVSHGAAGVGATMPAAQAGRSAASGAAGASGTTSAGAGAMSAGAAAPVAQGGSGADTPIPMKPALPSTGCGATQVPASGDNMIDVDGTMREYIVAVPSNYDPNTPYRLIFAWHGLGGSAMQIATSFGNYGWYGLQSRSANSAIFIAGQGLETMPSGAGGSGGAAGAGGASAMSTAGWPNTGDRDVAFTRKLVDWATSNYCIDRNRIFSVGMSYGGIMSNTLGCEMGDVFRAITPMSGSGPATYRGSKPCVGQVAAWMSHGNMDMTVPFSSGEASRDHWLQTNHCQMTSTPIGPDACVAYQGCDAGYPVHWCEFSGGHTIPSFAADGIWQFLSKF